MAFPDDKDVIMLRVKAIGKKHGRDAEATVELIDYVDEQTNFSATERSTGWIGAVVAELMARNQTPPRLRWRGNPVAGRTLCGSTATAGIKRYWTRPYPFRVPRHE